MESRRAYLNRHYASGHFLLSGRKVPRADSVMHTKANNLDEVTQGTSEDPIHQAGSPVT